MASLRFLLAATTEDNDYQREQVASALAAAREVRVELEVVFCGGDPIKQSSLLMGAVTSNSYQGIVFEPVGMPLPTVAEMAVRAGCGLVVLNRQPDYLEELRRQSTAPVFCISTDQTEVGRIQGRQLRALLPHGGAVLVIQGALGSESSKERMNGLNETKPEVTQVRLLRGSWTEASGYQAVTSWQRLNRTKIDAVVAQNDAMGVGARKALSESHEWETWKNVPILGADGLAKGGQRWVREGLLTATIDIPTNAGTAVEMLARALSQGYVPPLVEKTKPMSIPEISRLSRRMLS